MTRNPDLLAWHIADHGCPRPIDGVFTDDAGVQRGLYSGDDLPALQARYPGARITSLDEYDAEHDKAWTTEPARITAERFEEMLEILPPRQRVRAGAYESFKMIERLSGSITSIFARLGDSYWSFSGHDDMPHSEIIRRCAAVRAQEAGSESC